MKKFSLKETKLAKIIGAKGLYITIAACILALGGAAAAAYSKAATDIKGDLNITNSQIFTDGRQADTPQSNVEKDDTSSSLTDSSLSEEIQTQPNVMPVNGDVINAFSNGELVKSETLGVWKTHDGVDIKADKGTPVKAMNKGKVTEIRDDALWGNCVIIDHGNGITGFYYNLSKQLTVTEGDEVNSGEVIGSVGDTAAEEISLPSHLHFGLKKNGEWIDPIAFINPNSVK